MAGPGLAWDQPAGLHSFPVALGLRWLHKVPDTGTQIAPNAVELSFHGFEPPDVPEMSSHAV